MGGIVGKLTFDRHVQISHATVQRMMDAVAHRGATGAGERATYLGHGIALGSCDDTPTPSCQVAGNESSTIRVVADADLANAASLKRLLESGGHRLQGSTDAELIAHAYEEWGDACVERFAGPFACAIWDDLQRRLLLARDHFGVRPLCFALLHGDGVVFASELTALLQDPGVGRAWHPEAIDAYLALGYVPAPLTIHPRVSKLQPGHTLVADGRRLTTRQYWDLSSHSSGSASAREAIDLLESCLRTSVRSATRDADAYVLLSGGVASTAIAAVSPRGCASVAVGIDTDWSDLNRIAGIASHLGLRSEIDVASIDATELATLLGCQFDEPTADPGAVSDYAVFVAARRYGSVAVTGYGASAFWAPDEAHAHAARPRELFEDALRHGLYTRRFSRLVRHATPAARQSTRDLRSRLADTQLASADRAASAAGVRLRHPYLDRDIADLASRLTGSTDALRQVAARHIPAALLTSRSPRVSTPAWLSAALTTLVPQVLLTERFDTRGMFSRPGIRALWDDHRSGRRDHARRLWSLLMLEFWFREFIDGDAAALPLEYAVLVRAA